MIELNINRVKSFKFTQKSIKIGRNNKISEKVQITGDENSADISIKDEEKLSREHCKIFQQDYQWYIEDLDSSNGTYINNKKIKKEKPYILEDGDILHLSRDVCICVSFPLKVKDDSTVIDDDLIQEESEDRTIIDLPINQERDVEHTKKSDQFVFPKHQNRDSIDNDITIESQKNDSYRDVTDNDITIEPQKDNIYIEKIKYKKTVRINHISTNEQNLELLSHTELNNGQYVILNRLGEIGGFGITYLAEDIKLNSKVAIKEYFPKIYANRNSNNIISPINTNNAIDDFKWGYKAFKKEAQTIANIPRHNNIVDVKNLFEENGTVYYVMAYTEGEDLESYIKRKGRLNQKEIESIIFPFLDGVKHIHKHNILHRDIKLSNILITKDGNPILIDFGTARNKMIQRTKKLTTVYTEGYAPLEQHTGGEEGPYTDIYAIGMMIYAMMHGITDTNKLPSAIKRLDAERRKSSNLKFPKGFSKNFIKAIKKALEIQYMDRPQTIDEFITLLKKEESQNITKYLKFWKLL